MIGTLDLQWAYDALYNELKSIIGRDDARNINRETASEDRAILVACDAIEKRIPVRIAIESYSPTKCKCGHEFSVHHGDGYYSIPYKNKTNFCPDCGQALDWSER